MPNINITETDETARALGGNGDVVYIPGFASNYINQNIYILTKASDNPTSLSLVGTVYESDDTVDTKKTNPSLCSNMITGVTWKYTGVDTGWKQHNSFIAPHPEEEPTLCYTVKEFQEHFGDEPAVFGENGINITNYTTNTAAHDHGANIKVKGETDNSYIMALELLKNGIPVLYCNCAKRVNGARVDYPNIQGLYEHAEEHLEEISDVGSYNVKFITNGAYPAFEMKNGAGENPKDIAKLMIDCAKTRGDAIALIDHGDATGRALSGTGSVIEALRTKRYENGEFGAMFTPWAKYGIQNINSALNGDYILPASFAYLMCYARSVKNNPSWFAIAGVARAKVPYIKYLYETNKLTNAIANDEMQDDNEVSINPITDIRGYGLTIWGNRTLLDNSVEGIKASSYLNIRCLVSEIKKLAYDTAKALTFNPNNDVLWLSFKAGVMPLLDRMKTGSGISGYKIIKNETEERQKLSVSIKIKPVYAVEDFDINLVITDEDVSVQ